MFLLYHAGGRRNMLPVAQTPSVDDPIAAVLADFGLHHRYLATTFFKFNIVEREMALMVMYSLRRRHRLYLLEVQAILQTSSSIWTQVTNFPQHALRRDEDNGLVAASLWLGNNGAHGHLGSLSWDLVFAPATPLLDTQKLTPLHPFDLQWKSVPRVEFSGNLRVGSKGYSFAREPGTFATFYGRRLPDHMYWISANAFEQNDTLVECVLAESSIFGLPLLRTRVGYCYLHTPDTDTTFLYPLNSIIQTQGNRHDLKIQMNSRQGESHQLGFQTANDTFQSINDHFHMTLLGNCSIDDKIISSGTAMLVERKF
jgi:hypothetical protein